MKIIVNTPHIQLLGGVANHYKGLKKYWDEEVYYNYIGGRYNIPGSVLLIFDLIKFIFKLIWLSPDLLLLNPSLKKNALQRDALYLAISKFLNISTIVFFHGWDEKQAQHIEKNPDPFLKSYHNADAFLVLSTSFREQLIKWGIDKPVYLTTTKVDNSLIRGFNIDNKDYNKTLLFLARIVKDKGIFTTIEAFEKIKRKYSQAQLIVAGSGNALGEAKSLVETHSIDGVSFTGFITGEELRKIFGNSDLYLFPTEHGEGMPTSVLEAMAFGLPIISRPVGGMVDFFEEGKMGYLIESTEPDNFAEKAIELLENKDKLESMGKYNHNYASENFLASNVARNLENIFLKVAS